MSSAVVEQPLLIRFISGEHARRTEGQQAESGAENAILPIVMVKDGLLHERAAGEVYGLIGLEHNRNPLF